MKETQKREKRKKERNRQKVGKTERKKKVENRRKKEEEPERKNRSKKEKKKKKEKEKKRKKKKGRKNWNKWQLKHVLRYKQASLLPSLKTTYLAQLPHGTWSTRRPHRDRVMQSATETAYTISLAQSRPRHCHYLTHRVAKIWPP